MIIGFLKCVLLCITIYALILYIKDIKENERYRKLYISKFEEMFDRDRFLCYEIEEFIEDVKYKFGKFLNDE